MKISSIWIHVKFLYNIFFQFQFVFWASICELKLEKSWIDNNVFMKLHGESNVYVHILFSSTCEVFLLCLWDAMSYLHPNLLIPSFLLLGFRLSIKNDLFKIIYINIVIVLIYEMCYVKILVYEKWNFLIITIILK